MKLYMVRHGESETNLSKSFTGWAQVNLTEKGYEDARRAGEVLKGLSFDRIYASDLKRAIQTAQTAIPGCEPILDPLLREIRLGSLEMRKIDECHEAYGEQFAEDRQNCNFVPYGGENKEMIRDRIQQFMDKLAADPCDQAVAFAHAGTLNNMLDLVLGVSLERWRVRCPNCCIAVFVYENDRWALQSWGL